MITLSQLLTALNKSLSSVEPLLLIMATVTFCYVWFSMIKWLNSDVNETLWSIFTRRMRIIILNFPVIGHYTRKKLDIVLNQLSQEAMAVYKNADFITQLPQKGLSVSQILEKVKEYESFSHCEWKKGFISGAIYSDLYNTEFINLMEHVTAKSMYSNPLHMNIFPDIRKMEAEVIKMTCSIFKGGPNSCGVMTTGGSESIILAMKAYRNHAIWEKNITEPEIVAPVTAHPAFEKAAHLLQIKLIRVPINSVSKKVCLKKMKKAITSKTCCLVGSAPEFAYGVMDPIEEIAQLGLKYNIPVHGDCCLGGFLVPFVELTDYKLEHQCNFSVPGLTSISADTHKYGYAPKGTSVLMYSHEKYLHHQYFFSPDWPGGIYGSPTILGSRMGGVLAAAWASFLYHGLEGYVENARKIIKTANYIRDQVSKIKGIYICGSPYLSVTAIASNQINILHAADELTAKGWHLNILQFPSAFHICVTMMHTKKEVADRFIADVKEVVKKCFDANYTSIEKGQAALYGMTQKIPDRSTVKVLTAHLLDAYYYTHYN